MPIEAPYVLVVSMDVEPGHEDLFNEVYDNDHVAALLRVPGVRSGRRMKGEAAAMFSRGEKREVPAASPAYVAIYEIDGPEVLTSPEWRDAVDSGRWPSVRPHTRNLSVAVYRVR